MRKFYGTADEVAQCGYDLIEIADTIQELKSGEYHDVADEIRSLAEEIDQQATNIALLDSGRGEEVEL